MAKPYIPISEIASQFFVTNDNSMVMLTPDVQLMRNGNLCEVNTPWVGAELTSLELVFSHWYQSLIGRLRSDRSVGPGIGIEFMIIFPSDATREEAERCAETYMLLLNMVRMHHS